MTQPATIADTLKTARQSSARIGEGTHARVYGLGAVMPELAPYGLRVQWEYDEAEAFTRLLQQSSSLTPPSQLLVGLKFGPQLLRLPITRKVGNFGDPDILSIIRLEEGQSLAQRHKQQRRQTTTAPATASAIQTMQAMLATTPNPLLHLYDAMYRLVASGVRPDTVPGNCLLQADGHMTLVDQLGWRRDTKLPLTHAQIMRRLDDACTQLETSLTCPDGTTREVQFDMVPHEMDATYRQCCAAIKARMREAREHVDRAYGKKLSDSCLIAPTSTQAIALDAPPAALVARLRALDAQTQQRR